VPAADTGLKYAVSRMPVQLADHALTKNIATRAKQGYE
jgi:hypothetical protein